MSDDRLSTTPAGIVLAPLASIEDGAARNFVIQMRLGRFHGFVVRRGSDVYGWVDSCPHAGLPLALELDRYLSADGQHIVCGWHGAVFEPESGRCVGGPCAGRHLQEWPVRVADGQIVTKESTPRSCG